MIKLVYPKFWSTKNIISYLLWPLSIIYFFCGLIRKLVARPITLPATVICVGNVSVGGTGKTQIVIWLSKILHEKNISFVIITKAYNSNLKEAVLVDKQHSPLEVGDESVQLLEYGIVIAAKKIHQVVSLVNLIKPRVIIVDDGLQNPNFHKDFTILSIDADRGLGNGLLIPAGPLRQYYRQALTITDIVILVGKGSNKTIQTHGKTTFLAQIIPAIKTDIAKTKNYFAFTGIGNPDRFFEGLKNYGLKLSAVKTYPDHYNYSTEDIEYLKLQSERLNAILITTKKDYVKIGSELPVLCFDVELSIDNQQELKTLIYDKILQENQTSC